MTAPYNVNKLKIGDFQKKLKICFSLFSRQHLNFQIQFLLDFAIKMLLDNTYELLNLLEVKCNVFNSLF